MSKIFYISLLLTLSLAMYEGDTPVVRLNAQNYNQVNSGIWFVEYYASWCGHCQAMAPEWEKAARALKGIVQLAALDAGSEKVDVQGIQGFPTIRFLVDGKEEAYQGGRNARDFVTFALEKVKKIAFGRIDEPEPSGGSGGEGSEEDVVVLEQGNFDSLVMNDEGPWFVEFYAPWCGHCKNLAPEWAALGTELKGEVKVGKVDATAHPTLGQQFQVSGYPTIKYFPAGKKSIEGAVTYEGGRSSSAMAEWARDQNQGTKNYNLQQLNAQEVYDNVCKKKSVCVISFLPHILDSGEEQREAYLDIIKEVGIKFRGKPFSFIWSQGGDQLDFETIFGAEGSGYPSVVAVSHNKKLFSRMRKSFSEEHLNDFAEAILEGKGKFQTFNHNIDNIKTITAPHTEQAKQGCDEHKCTAPPEQDL